MVYFKPGKLEKRWQKKNWQKTQVTKTNKKQGGYRWQMILQKGNYEEKALTAPETRQKVNIHHHLIDVSFTNKISQPCEALGSYPYQPR